LKKSEHIFLDYLGIQPITDVSISQPDLSETDLHPAKLFTSSGRYGGNQYTGLDRFGLVIDQCWIKDSSSVDLERVEYRFDRDSNRVWRVNDL